MQQTVQTLAMEDQDFVVQSSIWKDRSYMRSELKAAFDKLLAQPATKESGTNWKAPIDSIVVVIAGNTKEFETMMDACLFFTGSFLHIVSQQRVQPNNATQNSQVDVYTVHADGYYAVIGA